ncbi:transcriptional regulator [bacterium (Candidatus Blackallbacteria) CG17_big_fil_post_rev_8_21_14_2_50_48_46]|uniref:Transcriptional regulator n=1 Tax=bacterium (Candidatus Blackallbacteria) CG17_big_fil_post_rev_8_21_14_2_50_48_46 TaxID=2014261 RepID=A0A2M7G9Z4_9BACT|nr:MAG: transcriptional regulator [bacterium (Candidatus Blackallbacteria) CG18_big_fil_WC_8_21_14_2_50_49_26]PIW18694.1 MAG: transcriptional regulator [bacterium (Candidatus Blackallbacteria) CG17_big_fil_post_rev_8_21_14_2_50_48_46]PIW46320.1 MAG: transcriptional regulator [bacterium (Candidatus Blackallbacteria) CG13_big_fil_rev_8_21_14_2_50_49_14]
MSITSVPLLDLSRTHQALETELQAAFLRVLHANGYILGPEVSQFESACADYLGVKHAIGVSSGSDALILALMALEIGPGDEVICPSYTFFATAGAIWRLGARPVFIDCDLTAYNIDLEQIEAQITPQTKAVIPVHLFGQTVALEPLRKLCDSRGIALIEDAAQAIGAAWKNQPAGSVGDFGCFSFFPSKNLGGFGDGGLLTTQSDELAERARILRVHGSKPKYYHHFVGGNFRLDALQAALLNVKLPHCESYAHHRQEKAEHYTRLLNESGVAEQIHLPAPLSTDYKHVYNQYVIRVKTPEDRESLQKYLSSRQIGTAIYYPVPLHLQACFKSLGYQAGDLPNSEWAAQTTLALPIFPELRLEEQEYVAEALLCWTAR